MYSELHISLSFFSLCTNTWCSQVDRKGEVWAEIWNNAPHRSFRVDEWGMHENQYTCLILGMRGNQSIYKSRLRSDHISDRLAQLTGTRRPEIRFASASIKRSYSEMFNTHWSQKWARWSKTNSHASIDEEIWYIFLSLCLPIYIYKFSKESLNLCYLYQVSLF